MNVTTARKLPIASRIRLVEDIWDSIAVEQNALTLTEAQRQELDLRLDAYEADGLIGKDAETVLDDIASRL